MFVVRHLYGYFREHTIHCKVILGYRYIHDFVRDVLLDILRRAGLSVKNETHVNFLLDPLGERLTLRPTDVMVYGCIGWKTCMCSLD